MSIQNYQPLSNASDVSPPSEEGSGFWWSMEPNNESARNFIEVHLSSTGRKICIRISEYDYELRRIQLGECVLLSRAQTNQLRQLCEYILTGGELFYSPHTPESFQENPVDDPNGCFVCSCGDDPHHFIDFMEVESKEDHGAVIEISAFSWGNFDKKSAVVLDSRKLERVRRVLGYLVNHRLVD